MSKSTKHVRVLAVYLCHSGKSFVATLADLIERSGSDCTPIFAFVDVEFNSESVSSRRRGLRDSISVSTPPSGASLLQGFTFSSESEDSYGLQLLALLSSDLQLQEGPKLIIPVAVLRSAEPAMDAMDAMDNLLSSESSQVARCLDAGAADVLSQPLQRSRVHGLVIHAYRARRSAQKEITRFMAIKKSRKHSWVGVQSEQPYAYLREAMFAPFSILSKTEAHC